MHKSDDANISAEIVEICSVELLKGFMVTNIHTKSSRTLKTVRVLLIFNVISYKYIELERVIELYLNDVMNPNECVSISSRIRNDIWHTFFLLKIPRHI